MLWWPVGHLPVPVSLMASSAAQHDLPAAKQIIVEDEPPYRLLCNEYPPAKD